MNSLVDKDVLLKHWTVDLRAARIFLEKHLSPVRKGHLRFLDFPPEIRTAIFEHALQDPPLQLLTDVGENCLTVYDPAGAVSDHYHPAEWEPRNLDETLAVIYANKQIYREALPVFYGNLQLRCRDVKVLQAFVRSLCASHPERVPDRHPLCTLEPIRFHCLKKLHIDYCQTTVSGNTSDPFADLFDAKGLRHLTLTIHEPCWSDNWDCDDEEPSELPHIASLVGLLVRVESYELQGKGGNIQRYIEAESRSPKKAVKSKE